MAKKRSQGASEQPSFAELYRMYEELLRLRIDLAKAEARAHERNNLENDSETDAAPDR